MVCSVGIHFGSLKTVSLEIQGELTHQGTPWWLTAPPGTPDWCPLRSEPASDFAGCQGIGFSKQSWRLLFLEATSQHCQHPLFSLIFWWRCQSLYIYTHTSSWVPCCFSLVIFQYLPWICFPFLSKLEKVRALWGNGWWLKLSCWLIQGINTYSARLDSREVNYIWMFPKLGVPQNGWWK